MKKSASERLGYAVGLIIALFFSSVVQPAIAAATIQVSVFSNSNLTENSRGCEDEVDNLKEIISRIPGYSVDSSITSLVDDSSSTLLQRLNASRFFFVPDMEGAFSANNTTYFPNTAVTAFQTWLGNGGVLVMTGTYGSKDIDFLNRVTGWTMSGATALNPASRNDTNSAGTPFGSASLSGMTLGDPSATDAINLNSAPAGANAKVMWGTAAQASVATLNYGSGTIIFLGWDFYNSGYNGASACSMYTDNWVQKIVPAALDYAAQLSESGLDNPTTTGGTLKYTFSENGTTSYIVLARDAAAPTASQIKDPSLYVSASVLASSSSIQTASTEISFTVSGLSASADYTAYLVTEYSSSGTQTFSSIETVEFSTVPGTPTVTSVDAGNTEVTVNISPSGTETNFEYSINGGSTWVARSPASTSSSWVITGLTNSQTYSFSFRSSYRTLRSATTSTFAVTPSSLPGLPRSLAVEFGVTQSATLSWLAPASDGGSSISSYVVQYDSGSGWQSLTASGLTAVASTVWLNQSWSFRVAAVSAAGTGSYTVYNHTVPTPASVSSPTGSTTLVSTSNQSTISATPGNGIIGTMTGGIVSTVSVTVSRITVSSVSDIQTQADTLVSEFNARWGGTTSHTPQLSVVDTSDGALIYGLLADPNTSDPIGIPAQDVILVTSTNEAVMLAARNGSSNAKVNPQGVLEVAQGALLAFAAHGFAPNTPGELVLMSSPTLLGNFTTDATGTFIGQVPLPGGIGGGNHTAVLITSGLVASLGLAVLGSANSVIGTRPYEGPVNLRHAEQRFCSGGTALVTGQRLDTVGSIKVGNVTSAFEILANGNLRYSLKDVLAGKQQVRFWVPNSSAELTGEIVVENCSGPATTVPTAAKVNVGSFNGKLVVYASGQSGKRISWKVGGRWGRAVASTEFARFDRPTPRRGVQVTVQIFVDGELKLTKVVRTR